MRKLIEHFLIWTGMLLLAAQSARAFSLSGPIGNADDAWQIILIGYGWDDPVAPKDIYEEYRPVVPVVYYASDESFLAYYGASGLTNVDAAFAILNGVMCGQTNTSLFLYSPTNGVTLPANGAPGGVALTISPINTLDSYDPSLSDFPLDSQQNNFTAQTLGLMDMKSYILHSAVLELGLADPTRYVWTLHDRFFTPGKQNPKCPDDEEYYVVQRNFDVSPGVNYPYSSYINGNLYTYLIEENCGNAPVPWSAITAISSADPSGNQYTAVASGGLVGGNVTSASSLTTTLGLGLGTFYTALTRDDVMGLKYLLSTNNINWENASADSQLFTITTNFLTQEVFPPSILGGTNVNGGTGGTNAAGYYYFVGTTNGGLGYGDLAAFIGFIKTNPPAVVQAAYPGVTISSYSSYPVVLTNETYSSYYAPLIGAPYPPPLIYKVATNYTAYWGFNYNYTFANVFTNHYYTNLSASWQTYSVSAPVGSPYGTPAITNTTIKFTNQIAGDFFVLPPFYTNVCPLDIVSVGLQSVLATTNFITGASTNQVTTTNTVSLSNSVALVTYFTNYSYVIRPVTCETGTNSGPALRRGLGRVQFIRANYDGLLGQTFQPITNNYSMVAIDNNNQPHTELYQRIVTAPDFVFQAADLTAPPPNDADVTVSTPVFDQSAIKTALAGPGTITPGATIVFNKNLNDLYLNGSLLLNSLSTNAFLDESTQEKSAAWGAFDGTTNYPVVYPSGTSIASLMNQIIISAQPSSLADGTNGVPYNGGFPVTFSATGGQPPYTWSAPNFSTLVPGMTFNSSPPAIYGTPSTPGAFYFTIQVTDSANRVVNLNYPIIIH